MSIHRVKLSAIPAGPAMPGQPNRLLGMAQNAGNFLLSEHPLPTYQAPVTKAFNPGWIRQNVFRQTPHGEFSPIMRTATGYAPQQLLGYGQGWGNAAKTVGHGVGEAFRQFAVGSPLSVDRDLRTRGYGTMLRDFYGLRRPTSGWGALNTAISVASPAIDLGKAVFGDRAERGANIGGAVSGALAAPITSRLGLPGALVQQPVQQFGRWIGSKFDPKPEEKTGSLLDLARKHPATTALVLGGLYAGGKRILTPAQPQPTLMQTPLTQQPDATQLPYRPTYQLHFSPQGQP